MKNLEFALPLPVEKGQPRSVYGQDFLQALLFFRVDSIYISQMGRRT